VSHLFRARSFTTSLNVGGVTRSAVAAFVMLASAQTASFFQN